jgi:SAM-dependent methyltransferase
MTTMKQPPNALESVGDAAAYRRWKHWDEADFGRIDQAPYYREELSKSGFPNLKGTRVLELGFGNGGFGVWSTSQGAEWVGTELDVELVERACKWGLRAFSGVDLNGGPRQYAPYDLIVAWDVIEHVPRSDLPNLLAECRSLLSPNGALLGRVPSGDSPFSAAIQSGDLTHSPALGSAAIRYLAHRCGFPRVEIRGAAFPIFGFGAVSAIRRSTVRFTDHLVHPFVRILMRARDVVLTPNMVFTLRQ